MANLEVRSLRPDDFDVLMQLERELFGNHGEDVLGPYYVRLCCDFFGSSCFIAHVAGKPAGYILSFIRDREVYCTTLAVLPEHQGTRVVHYLLRGFVRAVIDRCDVCWFTVKEDNVAARALHSTLGAKEVEVREGFYGPGDRRIISRIDREGVARIRKRYERLGFLSGDAAEPAREVA
jgi:ribosomal protein S18 acetylase RimI-like enzyme